MPMLFGEEMFEEMRAARATPRMSDIDHATIALRGAARTWVAVSDSPAGRISSGASRMADRDHLRAAIHYTRQVLASAVANGTVAEGNWRQMLDSLVEQLR